MLYIKLNFVQPCNTPPLVSTFYPHFFDICLVYNTF